MSFRVHPVTVSFQQWILSAVSWIFFLKLSQWVSSRHGFHPNYSMWQPVEKPWVSFVSFGGRLFPMLQLCHSVQMPPQRKSNDVNMKNKLHSLWIEWHLYSYFLRSSSELSVSMHSVNRWRYLKKGSYRYIETYVLVLNLLLSFQTALVIN